MQALRRPLTVTIGLALILGLVLGARHLQFRFEGGGVLHQAIDTKITVFDAVFQRIDPLFRVAQKAVGGGCSGGCSG